MKLLKFSVIFLIIAALTIIDIDSPLSSRNLFNLFTDKKYSNEGLEKAQNFNPDKDFLLPSLKDKKFFRSIHDLSTCRRRAVRKYIYKYLTSRRAYLKRSINRSSDYLKIIREEFYKNKDMPIEISMLPMLESGFSPNAVSRSNAVGLWQFIRETSCALGLKTDVWVDERRDLEKSTKAAIKHLRNLYKLFNSWELALAAYNGGAGHVKRAMIKTGINDFWELRKAGALRDETSEYVPKFAALLVIYNNQVLFDIEDELELPSLIETENLELEFPVNIYDISKISGITVKMIRQLNPELNKNYTPPYYKRYKLRLPIEAKKKLEKKKKILYSIKFKRLKRHIVIKGDTINKIAKFYKINPDIIITFNSLKHPYLIYPGYQLYIPI